MEIFPGNNSGNSFRIKQGLLNEIACKSLFQCEVYIIYTLIGLNPQHTYVNFSLGKHTEMKSFAYRHPDEDPDGNCSLGLVQWLCYGQLTALVSPPVTSESVSEAWVVLRVQLTSLHLGFPLLANPVSRGTEFYLTPSCFFGASPIPTRWADSARCSPSHTLLRRSSWKFPFTVLSPLHTLCASFPSAGLASACTTSTVLLCKIPSLKSDRTAHVVCSAHKNDVEKPLCLSRFWTYHIYPNWQNAAQVTRKRKQGREICL